MSTRLIYVVQTEHKNGNWKDITAYEDRAAAQACAERIAKGIAASVAQPRSSRTGRVCVAQRVTTDTAVFITGG